VSQRRPLVIALAAAVVVIVALLIALILSLGSADGGGSSSKRPAPSKPKDPRARDRAEITRIAMRFQRALAPSSSDNPCRYMTDEAQVDLTIDTGAVLGADCKKVVRAYERKQPRPLYELLKPGIQDIRFSPRVEVADPTGTAPGAEARWRGDPERVVTFVQQEGQWLVAK
jgi:hypothetical protein